MSEMLNKIFENRTKQIGMPDVTSDEAMCEAVAALRDWTSDDPETWHLACDSLAFKLLAIAGYPKVAEMLKDDMWEWGYKK
jgi:hypothetical protein